MILIADSGSTKTEWCLIDRQGKQQLIYSEGMSPYFQETADMVRIISTALLPVVDEKAVSRIYYYGTGCSSPEKKQVVQDALLQVFPSAKAEVDHDMMAAARALCSRNKGIAAILGTGSNSVLFDGTDIIEDVPSLGFILGDEGSGAYLGKQFIKALIYGELDEHLTRSFQKEYGLDKNQILDAVYRQPMPSRFLASFTKFIHEHLAHPFMSGLVKEGFMEFIDRHISKYSDYRNTHLHCTGSVAFFFKAQLQQACISRQVQLGNVIKNPMEGLIHYHLESEKNNI